MFKMHYYDIPMIQLNLSRKSCVIHSHNARSSNIIYLYQYRQMYACILYCMHIWKAVYKNNNKININISYPCFEKLLMVFLSNVILILTDYNIITIYVRMCAWMCFYIYI